MTEWWRALTSRRLRSPMSAGSATELSAAELQALALLAEDDVRMGDLAAHLGVIESTATRLVDRLHARGLAGRRPSQSDRRVVVAELTAAGRRLASEIETSRREFLAEILATLDPAERKELVRLFGKVTEGLRQTDSGTRGSDRGARR